MNSVCRVALCEVKLHQVCNLLIQWPIWTHSFSVKAVYCLVALLNVPIVIGLQPSLVLHIGNTFKCCNQGKSTASAKFFHSSMLGETQRLVFFFNPESFLESSLGLAWFLFYDLCTVPDDVMKSFLAYQDWRSSSSLHPITLTK